MKDIEMYIAQKKWMAKYPRMITEEILKKNEKLYDKLIMQKINENYKIDDKPYYNLEKQEVIK